MDDDKKPRASNVMQILPEPEKPQGLSREAMARVMKAAQENPSPAPRLRAHERKHPTVREYAEHLAGEPLTDDDIQPEQPSLAQRRVLGAEATQVLREFAAAAQARGPRPPRASQVPSPDGLTAQGDRLNAFSANPATRALGQAHEK